MNTRSSYMGPGLHIAIWAVVFTVPAIVFHSIAVDTGLPASFFILGNLYHIGLFYFNAYYLYPRLLTRRYWPLYIVALAIVVIASYLIKTLLIYWFARNILVHGLNPYVLFFPPIPFLVASVIYRLIYDRIRADKAKREAEAERLSTELKLLRSQVSPHFLFNVLTNMVSLARQRSPLLEPALIRLSDMMRYMLYETNGERFPLDKEVEYLRNYIELQQMRFGEDVELLTTIDVDAQPYTIEPMLLIPFVENAFKHGIGLVDHAYIHISLVVKEGKLEFRVLNNYNGGNRSKDAVSGIGLANVRNRLQLLYGEKHNLTIQDHGSIYDVSLKLVLS